MVTIEHHMYVQWTRIEAWFQAHLPHAQHHMHGPASAAELDAAQMEIGISFPADLRASYQIHNGDDGASYAFPNGHWLLPVAECVQHWHYQKDLGYPRDHDLVENAPAWHDWVATDSARIDGPVKPLLGSAVWIPVMSKNGDVMRFLDFNPAPGGVHGQVIEVDLECNVWRVLAPSFLAFLNSYADDLEQGVYTATEDGLVSADTTTQPPSPIVMPPYLRDIVIEPYDPTGLVPPILNTVTADQELVMVGAMGTLLGMGSSKIFWLDIPDSGEHCIVATAALTRGYGAIRVRQYARVRVTRYTGQFDADGIGSADDSAVQWLALEYTLLR